ncbi:DUF192 domain-containing protein [Halomicroarcula sp. GCM10025709]|uniref:DUF192 domain-containing protein n=1 Tax=Haloarcula TaxID=2237 RepID=UPI0024C21C10|nr:DUF192 domain-containing protein [Halomicroarcula sp. YJ-61-S]
MERRAGIVILGTVALLVGGAVVLQSGLWVDLVGTGDYERGTVTVTERTTPTAATPTPTGTATPGTTVAVRQSDAGPTLATVEVRIADTTTKRYVGLSETDELGPDEGMLFVHDEADTHAYVMRNMSFPLDIIFVDADGTITTIHHASLPPPGDETLRRYEGRGKYVLEVNRGWTNRTGVEVGDRVELPAGVA